MKQKNIKHLLVLSCIFFLITACKQKEKDVRIVEDFNFNWRFNLGDHPGASKLDFEDTNWQALNLPHDWSIESLFSEKQHTKQQAKKLPTGLGWYRKTFSVPEAWVDKIVSIEFDGIYKNSEVWINGHYLGKRSNGFIAFSYNLTDYLSFGAQENIIAVKVDNTLKPNTGWYTGSGIYRNVKLVATSKLHLAPWGTFVTTPKVSKEKAIVNLEVSIKNDSRLIKEFKLVSTIFDKNDKEVGKVTSLEKLYPKIILNKAFKIDVLNPKFWQIENPYLYKVVTKIYENLELVDNYETPLGIRYFNFDAEKGFSLNGEPTKIKGVCLQNDNGALGAVANKYALERKLTVLKNMGVNAIRTANHRPSSNLLQLCDEMGFMLQIDVFDVWKKKKSKINYSMDWDKWRKKDLEDIIKRARNHPSIILWGIGSDRAERYDKKGIKITKELVNIIKTLDTTRPITSVLTENRPYKNFIYKSGAIDVLGFNYNHPDFKDYPNRFKGKKMIATENVSTLQTRGYYIMPSDSIKKWSPKPSFSMDTINNFKFSAYDQVSNNWGSSHEVTWQNIKNLDYISGLFVWSGFDYLNEPTTNPIPTRSSYFGILDLAGFPKDIYYMYQSEWTKKDVLHLFPHWNWQEGKTVDVWAYYNNADEVELFLNGESLGSKSKSPDDLHLCWQVDFKPGTLKAVSRKNGNVVLEKEIHTAGVPSKIELVPNKEMIKSDGYDLVYVTINILDKQGNLVPYADNLVHFKVTGGGKIVGVDNGYQANQSAFKSNNIKAFYGKCLVIIQSNKQAEALTLIATTTDGLQSDILKIKTQ